LAFSGRTLFLQRQLYFNHCAAIFFHFFTNEAMVHYFRFLSPPQVSQGQRKDFTVSAVVAVTTDLGDTFLAEDIDLQCRIVGTSQKPNVVKEQAFSWKGGSLALKITVAVSSKHVSLSQFVRMHVMPSVVETISCVPKVMDVWSVPFELANGQRAEPLVDRELLIPGQTDLKIREEMGDSIARHIWDASLGFLIYLDRITDSSSGLSEISKLIQNAKKRRINILELGSGCGIVGIAFAQRLKSDVLLTDLDDASEILEMNVKLAAPKAGSSLRAEVLDWSSDLHDSLNAKYDLVLVSDCIYNPDSSVDLVETLKRLAVQSPLTLILVGFKRRHSADDIFFGRMKESNFSLLETSNVSLPHHESEFDATSPTVEFYTYQLR
jgi:Lysine methyltransferase